MSTLEQIKICSEALVRLGEQPIDTIEGPNTPEIVAAQLYRGVVDTALASHVWRFNRRIEALQHLGPAPAAAGLATAWALPQGCIRIVAPFVNGCAVTEWEPSETMIWLDAADTDMVELEYHARVDELRWTPAFRAGVVLSLAAAFAVPIREDPRLAEALNVQAQRQLAVARNQNAFERPARRILTGRFGALRRR